MPGVLLARPALIAKVREHVSRDVPEDAIKNEGRVLQLLGFVPAHFDYEAKTYALLESQLAGFYEPSDGTMYMASDLDDDNADATLLHELVHALQDQRWDLGKRSQYRPGQGDRSSAFSALAEGDATSAMADVLLARANPGMTAIDLPDELFAEQVMGGLSAGPTADVPHIMKTSLVAPYIDGTLFIHRLRRQGGWAAVNKAWDDPPVTSEQILHGEKWESREPAATAVVPTARVLGEGWAVADADTYGELGSRLAFEEWVGSKDASFLAAGWGGDSGVLLKKNELYAFAWRIRYDEAKAPHRDSRAQVAFAALVAALSPAHTDKKRGEGAPFCIERSELGPLAVTRQDRDLLIVAGPAATGGNSWSAAGDCAKARAWLAEIAGVR